MPSKPRKFNTALFFEVLINVIHLWNSFYDFSINFAQTYRLNIEIDWSAQIWCGLFSDKNGLGSTVPTGEYRERSTPAGPALNLALGELWAALFLRRWRIRPDVLWSPADLSLSLIWDGAACAPNGSSNEIGCFDWTSNKRLICFSHQELGNFGKLAPPPVQSRPTAVWLNDKVAMRIRASDVFLSERFPFQDQSVGLVWCSNFEENRTENDSFTAEEVQWVSWVVGSSCGKGRVSIGLFSQPGITLQL